MSISNHETTASSTLTDETAASCLMLLSRVGESERAFECKTCGKRFSTFQALGGHRASHKKPKLDQKLSTHQAMPRSHKCSICGAEFALGQALGGHMRRHRELMATKTGSASGETMPLLMRSSSKRVCLELDLNLTPRENELLVESELKLGKREFETKIELGRFQEYDLRVQIGKRRRFGDGFLDLVA